MFDYVFVSDDAVSQLQSLVLVATLSCIIQILDIVFLHL